MICVFFVVIDFVGIGGVFDVDCFFNGIVFDMGVNMVGYIVVEMNKLGVLLNVFMLDDLGFGVVVCFVLGFDVFGLGVEFIGVWGIVIEVLLGKDMFFGYWELVGVFVLFEWYVFVDKENLFF